MGCYPISWHWMVPSVSLHYSEKRLHTYIHSFQIGRHQGKMLLLQIQLTCKSGRTVLCRRGGNHQCESLSNLLNVSFESDTWKHFGLCAFKKEHEKCAWRKWARTGNKPCKDTARLELTDTSCMHFFLLHCKIHSPMSIEFLLNRFIFKTFKKTIQ